MNGQAIILFQKYSTLSGGSTYLSDPVEMTRWKSIRISVCLAGSTGTGTATAQASGSDDLYTWDALGLPQNLSGVPVAITQTDTARWIRLAIVVPGTMTTATVWATAILRDA